MKNQLALLASFALALITLSPIAASAVDNSQPGQGAEKGSQSSSYRTPNTDIKIKTGKDVSSLKDSDYVIVSSSTATAVKAKSLPSFKQYMDGKTLSVYLMTKADALKLQAGNPDVSIEVSKPVTADATQSPTPSWGLDRLDSPSALDNSYTYDTAGSNVKTYVIDTGINTTSSDFTGRIANGYTYFNDGYGYNDCNGHGTHVAGTIAGTTYGVAKTATIVPVKVLDCAGSGTNLSVVAGINWVVSTHTGGPAVINMSVGGSYDTAINNAVLNATNAGFTVVVAAGNSTANACNYSPSSAPSAITVGALDSTNTFASFSNYGSCVDISGPGVSIKSDYINSSTATATMSGTSMASPHVAGVVARLLEASPSKTPAQIAADLASLSTKNVIKNLPSGTVNNTLNITSSVVAQPTVTAPVTPTVKVNANATNISASITVPTGTSRPTSYSFVLVKNGAVFSTQTVNVSSTATTVTYSSPKLAKKSGTYVLKVTASNSAGTSGAFVSNSYTY